METENKESVPIWNRYSLTIRQASMYFGIGEKKLRRIINDMEGSGVTFFNGDRLMIRRKALEDLLDQTESI